MPAGSSACYPSATRRALRGRVSGARAAALADHGGMMTLAGQAAVRGALGKVKSPYSRLFVKFG